MPPNQAPKRVHNKIHCPWHLDNDPAATHHNILIRGDPFRPIDVARRDEGLCSVHWDLYEKMRGWLQSTVDENVLHSFLDETDMAKTKLRQVFTFVVRARQAAMSLEKHKRAQKTTICFVQSACQWFVTPIARSNGEAKGKPPCEDKNEIEFFLLPKSLTDNVTMQEQEEFNVNFQFAVFVIQKWILTERYTQNVSVKLLDLPERIQDLYEHSVGGWEGGSYQKCSTQWQAFFKEFEDEKKKNVGGSPHSLGIARHRRKVWIKLHPVSRTQTKE
ncbi:hypothetical protein T439DRAFT_351214 [Meredithblackwellia eburnea MCA 4105]